MLFLAAEHAANASPTAIELMPAITTLVVFAIFFIALRVVVWPKIAKGLDDRDRKIREEIKAAEEAREQAKAALAESERTIARVREEASRMSAQAKADAKALSDQLNAKAQADALELKTAALRDIDRAKQAALADLHAGAAGLGAAIAGKILRREISVQDQQRLVDESLRELAGAGKH
jgi:F-type H+-transporting ATPase subunit b